MIFRVRSASSRLRSHVLTGLRLHGDHLTPKWQCFVVFLSAFLLLDFNFPSGQTCVARDHKGIILRKGALRM